MATAVIAIVLAAAGTLLAPIALAARSLARHHEVDQYLVSRQPLGRPFTLGSRSLSLQAGAASFIMLALIAASAFFALHALSSK